jgi:hypothetical protein
MDFGRVLPGSQGLLHHEGESMGEHPGNSSKDQLPHSPCSNQHQSIHQGSIGPVFLIDTSGCEASKNSTEFRISVDLTFS